MPNWCYAQVAFKGKTNKIKRLAKDISKAEKFNKQYGLQWMNLRYFFALNNFDTVSFAERYCMPLEGFPDFPYYSCNFRANIYDAIIEKINGESILYTTFESAWYMDYKVLQIISMIYEVQYSAYAEEEGMGSFTKCNNGIDTYDYDYIIRPDYDQFEKLLEDDPDTEIRYINPVKREEEDNILDELEEYNIPYDTQIIEEEQPPLIYGVYYRYTPGVIYVDHPERYYPGLPPFNININN